MIPDLEDSINRYLEGENAYLKDNSLLISAQKSSVTLFSPDPHQVKTHPRILIEDLQLPIVQCPKILGVYLDTSLSFAQSTELVWILDFKQILLLFIIINKHSSYVAEREYPVETTSSRPWKVYPVDNRRRH